MQSLKSKQGFDEKQPFSLTFSIYRTLKSGYEQPHPEIQADNMTSIHSKTTEASWEQ